MLSPTALALYLLLAAPADRPGGISGTVVRADDRRPIAGAEVVLRVVDGSDIMPIAQTTADSAGRFHFERLPVDSPFQFLPGANHDGVHHPGPRLRLTAERPWADMTLVVHDAIRFPNPLVVRKHEIALAPKPGAIEVRETLTIDNPAAGCYVGHSAGDDAEPVTLTLAIPSDFERIIFDAEFFGRRFAVRDGKLVTSVPWTPGRKELGFTYTLPNRDGQRVWQRPLDLPSEQVSVRVRAAEIAAVTCTLGSRRLRADDEVQFASSGSTLPTGHVLRVEFGRGTLPLIGYARWLALVGLAAAIVGIYVVRRRRASRDAQTISAPAKSARRLRRTA